MMLELKFVSISSPQILLIAATFLTGLLAGVFFIWTNAITPGIGRLNDPSYLAAFQALNRTMLNPMFYCVFIGPLVLSILSAVLYKSNPNSDAQWILIAVASLIYFLGVFLVTFLGNIPLNEMLDVIDLSTINLSDAQELRAKFETKWNNLHLIRTITSSISFLLLILSNFIK